MSDCRFGVSPVNYPDPDPVRGGVIKPGFSGPGFQISALIFIF